MTAVLSWYDWAILYGVVAVGATSVVVLSAAVAGLARHAAWCRMSWRLAVVVLVVLVGGELTGVTRGVGSWTLSRCLSLPLGAELPAVDLECQVASSSLTVVQPEQELPELLDKTEAGVAEFTDAVGYL